MNRRTLQLVNRVGAWLALAAITVAPPLAVWRLIGRPWPAWSRLSDELESGRVSTDTTMRIAALAALVLWACAIAIIVREVSVVLRERRDPTFAAPPSSRSTGWLQRLVRAALAGTVTTAVAISSLGPAVGLLVNQAQRLATPEPSEPVATLLADSVDERRSTPQTTTTLVSNGRQTPLSIAVDLGDENLRDQIIELNRSAEWNGGVFPAGMMVHLPEIEWASGGVEKVAVNPAPHQEPTASPTITSYTVQPGDGMWDVAEALLGDGSRYRELADEVVGQQVAPGVTFTAETRTIHPGWVFTAPGHVAPPAESDIHLVEPGDTLSGIAERRLGDADRWPELWEVNANADMGDGRTFTDPNLILPGWKVVVPGDQATPPVATPAPSNPPTAAPSPPDIPKVPVEVAPEQVPTPLPPQRPVEPTSTVPPTPTPLPPTTVAASAPTTAAPLTSSPQPQPTTPGRAEPANMALGLGAAAFIGAGVTGVVTARRRQRLRQAGLDATVPARQPDLSALEALLRSLSPAERMARLELAIRAAAPPLAAAGARPTAALVSDKGDVTLLLDTPAEPSEPFSASVGDRWTLPASVPLESLAEAGRQGVMPCPTLAHVGSTDGQQIYVDLESIGVLSIDAHPVQAEAIVRAIATGLSVSPYLEAGRLLSVGLGDVVHFGNPNAEAVDTADEAVQLAREILGSTIDAARAGGGTFALRTRRSGEAWEPAVVCVTGSPLTTSDAYVGGNGLALVTDQPAGPTAWTLSAQRGTFTLLPLELEVLPVGITEDDVATLHALVDEASAPLEQSAPAVALRVDDEDPTPWVETPWSLLVTLLGNVSVVDRHGERAAFERTKALELSVWLSQHRDRATRSSARSALWDLDVRDATFANVVSDARRAMARLVTPPEGEEWIARTLTDQLPLHPLVVTDSDLLRARLDYVRGLPAADVVEVLRPGVERIVGMPFTGTSYLWTDSEGLPSALTLLCTSACTMLGQAFLALGDTDGVFWATGRGLQVLPGHEELIGLRMRAHAEVGDLAGVRREWETYERAINIDPWSDGEPSPKLAELRQQLMTSVAV